MAKKRLHVAQVGSALVEKERGGRMPQGMSENNRHPRTLAGEFDPSVERLVAKGSAGLGQERLTEIPQSPPPPTPKPHAFTASERSEPLPRANPTILLSTQFKKEPPFELKACCDNHPRRVRRTGRSNVSRPS